MCIVSMSVKNNKQIITVYCFVLSLLIQGHYFFLRFFFISPANKVYGDIEITLSACPPVSPDDHVRFISFLLKNIGSSFFIQRPLITIGCVMILT